MLYLLAGLVFLFPLFFLPIVIDPIGTGKVLFLFFACFLVLLIFGIKSLRSGKLKFNLSKLDFFVVLYFLINLVSFCFLERGTKVRSIFQPLGMGTTTALTFFYFFLAQLNHKKKKSVIDTTFSLSLSILSIFAALLFLLPSRFFPIFRIISSSTWSPVGSSLVLCQVIFPFLALNLALLVRKSSKKDKKSIIAPFLLSLLLATGLMVAGYQSYKSKQPSLNGLVSWQLTVETFKKYPLFGVGPGNFSYAFNQFRPLSFNRSEFWQTQFSHPKNFPLLVWTESGILGLLTLVLIFWESLKLGFKNKVKKGLLLIWLILLFLPVHITVIFNLFLILALLREKGKEKEISLLMGEKEVDLALPLVGIVSLALAVFFAFILFIGMMAEFYFFKGVKAAAGGRGGEAYRFYWKSVSSNRFLVRGRIAFSQLNLSLAEAIFAKENITEDEKKQVSQLLSSAVSEAKAATVLESKSSLAWENLALLYRRLVGTAAGAEDWTQAAYREVVGLSPFDPRLRVDFGGLLYGLGNFEAAGKQFEAAVRLKQDFANAWYNWAWAEKQQNRLQSAVEKLQQAVNLVSPDTTDFEKASKELQEWKEELGAAFVEEPKKGTGELKAPEPLPTTEVKKQLEIDKSE